MSSFWRILKYAFQDLFRNVGLSFMTVFILVLMLLSVNVLWSVDILTKEAIRQVKEQINMSLYFVPEAKDKDIAEIQNYLKSFPEVTDLKLLSREDVLNSFKERHKLSKEVLSALDELGSNPFGPTLVVKTKEPADYQKIMQALDVPEYDTAGAAASGVAQGSRLRNCGSGMQALDVPEYDTLIESKSFEQHQDAIVKLQNIMNRLEQSVFGLVILFGIISFLIIFNTIRVGIATQRIEIGIKRLVGASNWFIRAPYLMESLIFTLLSMAVTVGVIYLALRWVDPYLAIVFSGGLSLTNYYNSHILYVFGIQTVAVLILTVLSSTLAMRRQLKV